MGRAAYRGLVKHTQRLPRLMVLVNQAHAHIHLP